MLCMIRCTKTDTWMLWNNTCTLLPSLSQNIPQILCRMNRYTLKSLLNDQYFHMLGLPHSSTSSLLLIFGEIPHYNIYNSLCKPQLDKCTTPIYIIRQCICFTLIELLHQIHFKTKIPKTPSLYQFRGVSPKCTLIDWLKYFCINNPLSIA